MDRIKEMSCCFPKREHLCGQERISALYKEGTRFIAFPMRVTYRYLLDDEVEHCIDDCPRVQVLVWAPKSLFKKATDRNRVRRLMREAYRLEKEPLFAWCEEQNKYLQIAFNYMDKQERSLEELRGSMRKAIKKILS